jgi:Zn-dependent peptidase ImmA (M78 family)
MKNVALLKDLANCASAETLLAAILKHNPSLQAPIDVEAIARSVGITEFRDLEAPDLKAPACALMTDLAKTQGIVLAAPGTSAQRRRFAVAHQLGHFLLPSQRGDRQCSNRDLAENRRDTAHRKEEMQANRFAAGLLMPKPLFLGFVEGLGKPSVAHLPTIAAAFDVTLEAGPARSRRLQCVRETRARRRSNPAARTTGSPGPPPTCATGWRWAATCGRRR